MSKIHLKYDSNSGLTNNQLFKYTTNGSGVTSSIIYDDGTNVGIGTSSPTAKFHVLQNTIGTGAKAFKVDINTWGEVLNIDDNTYFNYRGLGANFDGGVNVISSGVYPSITFKYNSGTNTSGSLYGVGASMFLQAPTFGIGNVNFAVSASLHVQGVDATSGNFALKVDNSASSPLLYVRNDGNVGIGTSTPTVKLQVSGGEFKVDNKIDTTNHVLTAAGIDTVNWASCQLSFPASTPSVDWGSRRLYSAGNVNLSWASDLVKINTTNAVADLAGANGQDLRILGDANGTNGKGIYLKAYSTLGGTFRTGLKYLSSNSTEPFVNIMGGDSTILNYALKVENSATSPLLYIKNNSDIGFGCDPTNAKFEFSGGNILLLSYGARFGSVAVGGYSSWGLAANEISTLENTTGTPLIMQYTEAGRVGIGTNAPTAGTRLHVYRAVNDFLYEVKVENPTNGVSAASAILIQSNSGKLEFGQLSTLHTTYSGYGQLSDTFIRSGTGARNLNIITDPSNTGKILFWSRLNPTTDAAFPSLAIDGSKSGFNTLPNANSIVYIKGGDSTSSNYALKVDNSTSSPLLYVRNDGTIQMAGLQVGNAGLASGDLYIDTAANILSNGDYVVGRKA